MGPQSHSGRADEEALPRLRKTLERFGLEGSLAERVASKMWEGEGARERVWKGVLERLGLDPAELERWATRSDREQAEYERARDAARAALSGKREKQEAIGALTFLLVHAAPSGDSREIKKALAEIEPAWRTEPGCLEWLPAIGGVATSSLDPDVRRMAIALLGEIGDPEAADTLLQALASDGDTGVRAEAAHGLIGMAEALRASPRARAVLEEATDPKYLDRAANLVRYATQALERMGAPVEAPPLEVDWHSIVEDQVSPRDVRAILDHAAAVGAGVILRYYGPHLAQPAPETIGPLLALFEQDERVAVVHAGPRGHLFSRSEALSSLARETAAIDSYRTLAEELRRRGYKVGYVPTIHLA